VLTAVALVFAAVAEIAGCFAVWAVLRNGATAWWLVAAAVALAAFAAALTVVPSDAPGRVFAAYGGVYVAASLAWLRLIDGQKLQAADIAGGALCLLGAAVVLLGEARRG